MKVQSAPIQAPTRKQSDSNSPSVGFEKGETVSITRTFDVPVYTSERLGSVPDDKYEHEWNPSWPRWRYDWSESHSAYGNNTEFGPVSVYRNVPVYTGEGKPQMKTVTETLTETAYNQKSTTLWSAGIGAAAGLGGTALVGAIQGAGAIHPLAAIAGTVLGAAAGAAIGFKSAQGDKVVEKWETHSITHPRMAGYEHRVDVDDYTVQTQCHTDKDGKQHCDTETRVRGYWHRYAPDIRHRQVGSYQRPGLEHTNPIHPVGAAALGGLAGGAIGVGLRLLAGVI